MKGQLSCQPELWAHVKSHLEVEGFASSFAHVVIERSWPLTTGLPHNMEARPPKVTWSKRVKQRETQTERQRQRQREIWRDLESVPGTEAIAFF